MIAPFPTDTVEVAPLGIESLTQTSAGHTIIPGSDEEWNDWLSALDHSVELKRVDSLYKGLEDPAFMTKAKNEVKLLIRSLGLWQKRWS